MASTHAKTPNTCLRCAPRPGVEVREVVYVWFLSSFYPRAALQGASVLLRLVTIAAELAVLIAIGLPWLRRRMEAPPPPPPPPAPR